MWTFGCNETTRDHKFASLNTNKDAWSYMTTLDHVHISAMSIWGSNLTFIYVWQFNHSCSIINETRSNVKDLKSLCTAVWCARLSCSVRQFVSYFNVVFIASFIDLHNNKKIDQNVWLCSQLSFNFWKIVLNNLYILNVWNTNFSKIQKWSIANFKMIEKLNLKKVIGQVIS